MCIVGDDNKLYIVGGNNVDVIEEVIGKTFDTTDSSTYTITTGKLTLPENVAVKCVTKRLGKLIFGGDDGLIYPWNKTDASYSRPVISSDSNINVLITINNTVYAQIGDTADWYVYDGVRLYFFARIPQALLKNDTTIVHPEAATEYKGKLIFGTNGNTYTDDIAGVYSIDLATRAVACEDEVTGGNNDNIRIGVILPVNNSDSKYYVGYFNEDTELAGIDQKASNLATGGYTGDKAYFETELIDLISGYGGRTMGSIEVKLARTLATSDSVKIYYRESIDGTYKLLGTFDTVGRLYNVFRSVHELRSIQLKVVINKAIRLTKVEIK